MSWPWRAMIPSRVISRLVVIVYVEVSQLRNGRSTHHTITTSATIQTSRLTNPSSTRRSRKIASASVITRTTPGTISAFTCVRVSTTTDSPSVNSFAEMATAGSLSLSGPDVHHIAGSDGHGRTAVPGPSHDEPAVLVDLGRRTLQHGAVREIHPDVAAGGDAQCPIAADPSLRGPAQEAQLEPQPPEHRSEELGAVAGAELEGETAGGRHGQLVLPLVDVDADADDREGLLATVCPDVDPLDEDPADLAVGQQHVVGPLQRAADRQRDGVPGDERNQRPPLVADHRVDDRGERQRRPRRRRPGPAEPSSAGGLVV